MSNTGMSNTGHGSFVAPSDVGSVGSAVRLDNAVAAVKKVRQQVRSITSGAKIDDDYEPAPYERSTQQDDIQSLQSMRRHIR